MIQWHFINRKMFINIIQLKSYYRHFYFDQKQWFFVYQQFKMSMKFEFVRMPLVCIFRNQQIFLFLITFKYKTKQRVDFDSYLSLFIQQSQLSYLNCYKNSSRLVSQGHSFHYINKKIDLNQSLSLMMPATIQQRNQIIPLPKTSFVQSNIQAKKSEYLQTEKSSWEIINYQSLNQIPNNCRVRLVLNIHFYLQCLHHLQAQIHFFKVKNNNTPFIL